MCEQFLDSVTTNTATITSKGFCLAMLVTSATMFHTVAAGSDCIDPDGDGWGWNGTQTCQVGPAVTTNGICDDPNGDGWGWDGTQTCQVSPAAATNGICDDPDGDGWGWDGTQTCQISTAVTTNGICDDPNGDGWGWDGTQTCQVSSAVVTAGICDDPDGDGWGWDGTQTCQVSPAVTTAGGVCDDPDGDGWGWDGTQTCQVSPAVTTAGGTCDDPDGDGWGWDGTQTCQTSPPAIPPTPPTNISAVTDVLLMMGQSNALGEDTSVDMSQDLPNDRVIAWTQFDGWQVANLCTQKWQKAWFPWRGGICSNHPAFQIARQITRLDSTRKIAVIPTGTAGKPISWWDANGIADQMVNATVQNALAALGRDKVDLIAWSQGEADHGNEAAWALKLNDLITRLRQRPWFDAGTGQFIAQETKWSTVNSEVVELANDNDPLTNWVAAADQPTKDGVHWSGPALRVISQRYANEYLY